MPYRYFIQLCYDGTGYCGWQSQPNALTVQAVIENALEVVSGNPSPVTGCGRTDTGVSASAFYAHFDAQEPIQSTHQLAYKLNSFLPPDVAVQRIFPVSPGSHARFSAISREYKYQVITRKDPFLVSAAYQLPFEPDVERMNKAAAIVQEYHDFQCFSKSRTGVKTYLCSISEAKWEQKDHKLLFTIRSDRFLRNMVRAIVGTLLDVGKGRKTPDDLHAILQSRNRSRAGYSVPAKGLTLSDVVYPSDIFTENPVWFSRDETIPTDGEVRNPFPDSEPGDLTPVE